MVSDANSHNCLFTSHTADSHAPSRLTHSHRAGRAHCHRAGPGQGRAAGPLPRGRWHTRLLCIFQGNRGGERLFPPTPLTCPLWLLLDPGMPFHGPCPRAPGQNRPNTDQPRESVTQVMLERNETTWRKRLPGPPVRAAGSNGSTGSVCASCSQRPAPEVTAPILGRHVPRAPVEVSCPLVPELTSSGPTAPSRGSGPQRPLRTRVRAWPLSPPGSSSDPGAGLASLPTRQRSPEV